MPDSFDLAALEAAVAATQFAGHAHHLPTTHSTNALALKAAQSGARLGVWIADQQIAGRGRGAHTWHSPAGAGLYMTALAAPPIPMQSALGLSFQVAIAAQSAIASVAGFRIREEIDIRWPNDLMLNGRKVGGILIDTASNPATAARPAMLRYAVIGIGINVNHAIFPPELDAIATSLRRESVTRTVESHREPHEVLSREASSTVRSTVDNGTKCLRREPLAAAILIALDSELRALTANREPRTANLTQYSSWISGKRVRVEARDNDPGGYTGTTAGLDPQGFLLVAGDDSQIHTVLSGGLREL